MSFDIFNLDGIISYNLALVLFLTQDHQACVESLNEVFRDYVFSAVVMYKPMAQHMCPLSSAVNDLCEFARNKTPALALISLSEAASYFPYPLAEDHVNYAIVLVDNIMTGVVGLTSEFLVGRLLCMIEDDVMNIVLPPAFGINADAWDFDWVTHPVCKVMWSNYQFVDTDNGDENFTHMVPVAPMDVFQVDPGDQVPRSVLGLCLVSPPQFMYQTDLTKCGYDVASQFALALQKDKSLTVVAVAKAAGTARHGMVLEDNSHSVTKATEKCKIKSSMKSHILVPGNSLGRSSRPSQPTAEELMAPKNPMRQKLPLTLPWRPAMEMLLPPHLWIHPC